MNVYAHGLRRSFNLSGRAHRCDPTPSLRHVGGPERTAGSTGGVSCERGKHVNAWRIVRPSPSIVGDALGVWLSDCSNTETRMASAMERQARAYTRTIWLLMVVAVVCSLGLLVAAETFPAYESDSVTIVGGADTGQGTTSVSHTTATLVEVNGPHALAVMALPLVASLVVAVALLRRRRGRLARVIAWGVTGVMGLCTMLAMLTVGSAMLPVTGCLVAACGFDVGRPSRSFSSQAAAG